MRLMVLVLVLLLATIACYSDDRQACINQHAECVADCGDQSHFEIPIEGDCTQQCVQALSKCVRRARLN
jgi:hypothetical protein